VGVCEGDVIVIPPGCVHALGGGIIVYEVQESCDLTYRIYDWGRVGFDGKPRGIHLDEALEVTDFSLVCPKKGSPLVISDGGVERRYLAACQHYAVQLITISEELGEKNNHRVFQILSAVEGSGRIIDRAGGQTVLRRGESLLLPATIGTYQIESDGETFTIIRVYVPDLLEDIVKPLREYGFSDDEIVGLGGEGRRNDLAKFLER
jgi:mannose-6-phosphate isomerase